MRAQSEHLGFAGIRRTVERLLRERVEARITGEPRLFDAQARDGEGVIELLRDLRGFGAA